MLDRIIGVGDIVGMGLREIVEMEDRDMSDGLMILDNFVDVIVDFDCGIVVEETRERREVLESNIEDSLPKCELRSSMSELMLVHELTLLKDIDDCLI